MAVVNFSQWFDSAVPAGHQPDKPGQAGTPVDMGPPGVISIAPLQKVAGADPTPPFWLQGAIAPLRVHCTANRLS